MSYDISWALYLLPCSFPSCSFIVVMFVTVVIKMGGSCQKMSAW